MTNVEMNAQRQKLRNLLKKEQAGPMYWALMDEKTRFSLKEHEKRLQKQRQKAKTEHKSATTPGLDDKLEHLVSNLQIQVEPQTEPQTETLAESGTQREKDDGDTESKQKQAVDHVSSAAQSRPETVPASVIQPSSKPTEQSASKPTDTPAPDTKQTEIPPAYYSYIYRTPATGGEHLTIDLNKGLCNVIDDLKLRQNNDLKYIVDARKTDEQAIKLVKYHHVLQARNILDTIQKFMADLFETPPMGDELTALEWLAKTAEFPSTFVAMTFLRKKNNDTNSMQHEPTNKPLMVHLEEVVPVVPPPNSANSVVAPNNTSSADRKEPKIREVTDVKDVKGSTDVKNVKDQAKSTDIATGKVTVQDASGSRSLERSTNMS
jgi:hypothetical protein